MRILAAALALSACVTSGDTSTPTERVAGCWINRDVGAATMRWMPDPTRPNVMNGAKLVYRQVSSPVSTRYTLEPSETGWAFCELDAAGAATRCWRVAQGESGSLEGGRVFIDQHGDRLRISVVGDGSERVIFYGRRDGCD